MNEKPCELVSESEEERLGRRLRDRRCFGGSEEPATPTSTGENDTPVATTDPVGTELLLDSRDRLDAMGGKRRAKTFKVVRAETKSRRGIASKNNDRRGRRFAHDNGVGIPAEVPKTIFNMAWQAEQTRERTGLGTAVDVSEPAAGSASSIELAARRAGMVA